MKATLYVPGQCPMPVVNPKLVLPPLRSNRSLDKMLMSDETIDAIAETLGVQRIMLDQVDRSTNHIIFMVGNPISEPINIPATVALQGLTQGDTAIWNEYPIAGPCLVIER